MSEAITQWLGWQCRAVEVSGRSPESLRLVAGDGTTWAQWPIATEGLAERVAETQVQLSEQLAPGKHSAQLVVYDSRGEQYSAMPVTITGRNKQAATAAQESRTLQAATSIAIGNLEAALIAVREENQRLSTQNEKLYENTTQLIEVVMQYQTTNTETDLLVRQHDERAERLDKLIAAVTPAAATVAQLLAGKIAKQAEAKGVLSTRPRPGTRKQSANGAAHDSAVQSPRVAPNGAANGKDGSRARPKQARRSNAQKESHQ